MGRQREFGFLMRARSWLATALVGNAGQPCERAQRVLTPANSFKLPPLGSMRTFIKELIETLFDFSLSDVFMAVSLPERGVWRAKRRTTAKEQTEKPPGMKQKKDLSEKV